MSEDRLQRAGGLHAAHDAAHQHQRERSNPAGAGPLRNGFTRSNVTVLDGSLARFWPSLSGSVFVSTSAIAAPLRLSSTTMCRELRANGTPGAAAQRAVRMNLDAVARPRRRDRHRARWRYEPGARQQPAGEQRFGKRNGHGEPPGNAENRKAVGEVRAGAALFFRHPGERQPGFGERVPQRLLPALVLGAVDRLGIGQIRKNTRRCFGDDIVILARHNWFARFPSHADCFDRRCRFLDMRNGEAKRDCWQASSGSDLLCVCCGAV